MKAEPQTDKHLPKWVRGMDEKSKEKWIHHRIRHHRRPKYGKHIFAIILNSILIYVVTVIPDWFGLVSNVFQKTLPYIVLTLVVTLAVNIFCLFRDDRLFSSTAGLIINLGWTGIWYYFYQNLPFKLSIEHSALAHKIFLILLVLALVFVGYHIIKIIIFSIFKYLR